MSIPGWQRVKWLGTTFFSDQWDRCDVLFNTIAENSSDCYTLTIYLYIYPSISIHTIDEKINATISDIDPLLKIQLFIS